MKIPKLAIKNYYQDQVPRKSAALAYYAMFSLAPLLLIMITVSRFILETATAKDYVISQAQKFLGPAGVELTNTILTSSRTFNGQIATIIGVIILFFGAEGAFRHLKGILNTIWEVKPEKKKNELINFLIKKLFIFLIVLSSGIFLIGSFLLTAVFTRINNYLPQFPAIFWEFTNTIVSLGVVTILFFLAIKFLPDIKIKSGDVWLGAFVAAILFLVGKILFGLYLGLGGISSVYGAAGSIIGFLAWLYYSAQMFLFGAEITKASAKLKG